jgi:hypothetical protein
VNRHNDNNQIGGPEKTSKCLQGTLSYPSYLNLKGDHAINDQIHMKALTPGPETSSFGTTEGRSWKQS